MSTEKTVDIGTGAPPIGSENIKSAGITALPVVIPPTEKPALQKKPERRHWVKPMLLVLVILGAGTGGAYWWLHPRVGLPIGIAEGNGRIEADEIDIDTKFAGRIAKLFADEGDLTTAGEVLVMMDTQDLAASLKKSQALMVQAQKTIAAAQETMAQQKSQVLYAQQEIARTEALLDKGFATKELLDQRKQTLVSALAGQSAASDVIGETQAALDAASHDAELYQVDIADNSLVSPRDGRIQYRVANVGEVLPVGGKVFTILDTSYVYMDIYLPTLSAGKVKLGSDARIVLDSYPTHPFAAKVVFVASQAQFTPKTVETQDERDVLMFRIRVRIASEVLKAHAASVRSGLPGVAYVETDPKAAWPATLQGDVSK